MDKYEQTLDYSPGAKAMYPRIQFEQTANDVFKDLRQRYTDLHQT